MRKMILSLAAAPLMIGAFTTSAVAAEEGMNILEGVKFKGEIRPRYEYADVDGNTDTAGEEIDPANAFTTRTMLSFSSDSALGIDWLGVFAEVNSVNNFGYDNYNSTANGQTQYDVIADPNQARMTQAYIDLKLPAKTLVRTGRQDVNLDNQRFIGTVDWRQMKQTYDAAAVVSQPVDGLFLLGAYVYGINGVKVQPNNKATETGSALFNAHYKIAEWMTVTGYAYLLASIHDTYGGSLTGNIPVEEGIKLDYRAEYAVQTDPSLEYRIEDVKADASYYNLDLGANISGILAGLNYEVQSGTDGSDDKTAFTTPLGTNHKFNGWADVFLTTPSVGLIDMNARLGYTAKGLGKLIAFYHKFDSDVEDVDLGSEVDVLYVNGVPGVNGLSFLAKAAFYSKGDTGYDVTKGWLQLDYKFASN